MSKITIKTPVEFIALAKACDEALPEVIVADVSIDCYCDAWEASVNAISDEAGISIDSSWLDENAGYVLTLREQIKLHAMQERFPGRC